MSSSAERMDRLIKDILEYSQLSQEEMHLRRCDLESALQTVVDQLETRIDRKDADIDIERPLEHVMATPAVLHQVLTDLISNAIKFVPDDREPEVRVWNETSDGKVRSYVEDNGIGVDTDDKEKIFKMFERLHGRETYRGTGVGLAVVKKGVEKLEGDYGFESTPDEGRTFWIDLKRAE